MSEDKPAPQARKGSGSAATSAEMLTPHDWAVRHGEFKAKTAAPQSQAHYGWRHAAADALFGWSDHAYHFQAEADRFLLTEQTYKDALDRAAAFPVVEALPAEAFPRSQDERRKLAEKQLERGKKRALVTTPSAPPSAPPAGSPKEKA